jgi:hypothetical protein
MPVSPSQDRTLPVQGTIICVLAHHRVDHQPITGQALINDPGRQRRTQHALLFAPFTDSLLALGYPYKVFCGFDINLFRTFVADDNSFFAALTAVALIGCEGDDLFDSWQLRRQLLPTGMLARFLKRQFKLLALTFGFDFGAADPRLDCRTAMQQT